MRSVLPATVKVACCCTALLRALAAGAAGTSSGRDVDRTAASLFKDAGLSPSPEAVGDGVTIHDRFGRCLNGYGINLVDWQGYLANPYVEFEVKGPKHGAYPLNLNLRAQGTSRLMLNVPSTLSAEGAQKKTTLKSASESQRVKIAIHPDRGGENEVERYELVLEAADAAGKVRALRIPIRVLDQDEAVEKPSIPIKIDARFDNLGTRHFAKPGCLEAASQAVYDWFYFFDLEPFDEVGVGEEKIRLPREKWRNHDEVANNEPFTGMWVFFRSFDGPYSTGFPCNMRGAKFHTRSGKQLAEPLFRSYAYILHFGKGRTPFTSLDDERFHEINRRRGHTEIYGLTMHEFGHAIAYHGKWRGINQYKQSGGKDAERVIEYQGHPVPLGRSYHIPGGPKYWDRLSGQNGGWRNHFPLRRWMLTKLTILIAAEAGWPLKETLTPFVKPAIAARELPDAWKGSRYRVALAAAGGVPFYDWTVSKGKLPEGFSLNRFTGVIAAAGKVRAARGTHTFTVRLKDYDELSKPAERQLRLRVR